ncbi:hypothetical protein [Streptomyces corynorhini]|uniref:Uncharacterized protein n=1 Tax=Streptomyces corynorhini TaxID=2282652 RepID=A0A370BBU8_9ACTN|nr:hypothetical protein [Streptomyces corynorhini]RDG37644.1 hypothetical protein DVH02_13340 [Streptomyces corynorhini]
MDEERAGRLVSSLRARGVLAHLAHLGVYQCGVQIVLIGGGEAIWDIDAVMGLRAEVVQDGVLVGFVPHVRGSEEFTEEQLVQTIATARYDKEGLHPPADTATGPEGTGGEGTGLPYRGAGPALPQRRRRGLRLPRWPRRPG